MEGVNHPARTHSDERRTGWFDVFPPEVVEVNVVVINDGQNAGDWHCHERQDDYWFVAEGSLIVGLDDVATVLVPGRVLHIPAGVWHTYQATERTILVYGLTNKWDGSDELRRPYDGETLDIDPD